ncbi:MAG: glycerophosphodiester phosphodiesterase family protein [Planctomycetota bacterium]
MKHAVFGMFFMFALATPGCTRSVEIIAHRGASHLAPENTMASVMLGWEKGADVEVDVYMTADNRIVVIHDSTTKRTGGAELEVRETSSGELRELEVGSFKAEEFAGERIPFLSEVIETIPPGRKLYVEIKCGQEILPFLQALVVTSGRMSQIVIIGFDLDTVTKSKQLIDVPTYWLKGTAKNKETDEWIPHDPQLVGIAADNGLDGMDVHYAGVTREFAEAARSSGQKLYVWTVDDPVEAKRLVGLGVAGITTNRPGWLRDQLNNHTAGRQEMSGEQASD